MTTRKKRITITLSHKAATFLKNIALRDHVPQSTKAAELIKMAMIIEGEDFQDAKMIHASPLLS